MKILVVGAGSLGSVFGCILNDHGHEVGFLEPGPNLEDIRRHGLRVTGLFGDHYCRNFMLYSSSEDVPVYYYELVLVTVKSFDTAEAVEQISPFAGENTLVMSLQNGLGNYEAIRDCLGENRSLSARVIFGARMKDTAHAEVTVYAEPVMVGSPSGAVDFDAVGRIARAFADAGIPTEPTEEIVRYLWAKMLYNCSLNPLSALLNVPYGRLLEAEGTKRIMEQVVGEVFQVAQARGVKLFWDRPEDYVGLLFGKLIPDTSAHFASMAQDIQAGRKTEIEALNGAVVRLGGDAGIECPANAMLAELIQSAERLGGCVAS